MSKVLKKISFLMVFVFAFSFIAFPNVAKEEKVVNVDLDNYLSSIGIPAAVIEQLPEEQKQLIFETSNDEETTFSGYDTRDFSLSEDGTLTEIKKDAGTRDAIPSTDLTLSVIGLKLVGGTTNEVSYNLYPLFKWHIVTKVNNDTFAFSMYPGWEAVPGERSLLLHLCDENENPIHSTNVGVSQATSTGYAFTVDSTTGAIDSYFIGGAYMKVKKVSSTASPNISITYVHDKSPFLIISYGITIGVGSISVSGNLNYVDIMADNFVVSGLVE